MGDKPVVGSDALKAVGTIPAVFRAVVPHGAVVAVNVFEGFSEARTGKAVGDAKRTDSLDDLLDDGVVGESVVDAGCLGVTIIVWQRVVI